MNATVPTTEFRRIPLTLIFFSNTSSQELRRERFNKEDLAELAESIKAVGVAQPILVRPLREQEINNGDAYELVAGERRVRAAKIAGLEEIPATIRELTDEQVIELQLIENLQREGLHELAEAEGYEQLLAKGRTVDEIADKVGKSRGTVYARMKLLALSTEARKAFYKGEVSASIALMLARIPDPKLQKDALKAVTQVKWAGDEPMSVRKAQQHIHDHYMLKLSEAPFKIGDADLVPKAGACGACPKRTGNQPELFGDVKSADMCTDPTCFKQKVAAHTAVQVASAKKTGQPVIEGKEAKKVAKYGVRSALDGYVKLNDNDYQGAGGSYRKTLGKTFIPTLLVDPESGVTIEVAPRAAVEKAHGVQRRAANAASKGTSNKPAKKKEDPTAPALIAALFEAIHAKAPRKLDADSLVKVVGIILEIGGDAVALVEKAHGWKKGVEAESLKEPELLNRLIWELLVAEELDMSSDETRRLEKLTKLATSLKIDAAAIKAKVKAAAAPTAAPAAGKAKVVKKPRLKK